MTIVGICGFESSGKDTIAKILIDNYGFKKVSFACVIKDIVSILFSWDRNKLEGLSAEDREWRETVDVWWSNALNKPGLTPRYVLRYFGTELFRNNWHTDFWVKVVERQLQTTYMNQNVVITDCRFENEIEFIRNYGGKIIQIHRNLPSWFNDYKNGIDVEEVKRMHASETSWIRCGYDYVIDNNGTIDGLHEKINILAEKLLKDN